MNRITISLLLSLPITLLPLAGCDQFRQPQKPETKAAATDITRPPIHRFTPIPNDFNVAFDTKTGEICRTWDWKVLGKSSTPDPVTGDVPTRQFGELAPTCIELYDTW